MKNDTPSKYDPVPPGKKRIITPYITIKGRQVWHPTGGKYVFFVDDDSKAN